VDHIHAIEIDWWVTFSWLARALMTWPWIRCLSNRIKTSDLDKPLRLRINQDKKYIDLANSGMKKRMTKKGNEKQT